MPCPIGAIQKNSQLGNDFAEAANQARRKPARSLPMRPKKAAVRVILPLIAASLIAWSPPALAQQTAAERAVERERRAEAGPVVEAGDVARQAEAIQTVEALLRRAEAAQQQGDCPAFEEAMAEVAEWTDYLLYDEGGRSLGRNPRNMTYDQVVPAPTQNEHGERRARLAAGGCPLRSADEAQAEGGEWVIGGSIGLGQARLPRAFQGFVERNGDETPANASRRTNDFVTFNAFVGFLVGGRPLIVELSHAEGDSDDAFDIEPLIRSGAPYAALSPGQSTGFSAFEGLNGYVQSDVEVQRVTATYNVGSDLSSVRDIRFRGRANRAVRAPNAGELFERSQLGLGLDVFTEVSRTETDHLMEGGISGTTAGGFNFDFSNLRQFSLEEVRASVGLLGRVGGEVAPNVAIEFAAAGGLAYSWRDFDLVEINTINFGPDAPGFTHSFSESDDGFGAFARGSATIIIDLSGGVSLFARGRLGLDTDSVSPFTPLDGDAVLAGERAGIATDDIRFGSLELGLVLKFGTPAR
jgi:hypothetical protein